MKKRLFKTIGFVLALPVLYILISLLLTYITVNNNDDGQINNQTIYLNSNGVHLDIVIPIELADKDLLKDLYYLPDEQYLSIGWGDENFYINTPTWGDLSFKNAVKAMLLKSTTLMHVTRYHNRKSNWVAVKLNKTELTKLNKYIVKSFQTNAGQQKIIINGVELSNYDNFYKAIGSYSCCKTCNTWANSAFKESGLKACLWTPFDFGLLNKYK
jgi:uncharacterized protein (TIGR02117 family)